MADYSTTIEALISEIRSSNPRLYEAISLLNKTLFDINEQLNPLVQQSIIRTVTATTLAPPTGFTFALPGRTVRFSWAAAEGASFYEVREGTDWDTATFRFRTSSLGADIDPLLTGDHTFLLKSVTADLIYSESSTSLLVPIPSIGVIQLTSQLIDNSVLLSWSTPTSVFVIDHYNLYRDDILQGQLSGNFTVRVEPISGTYTYKIIAFDIANNQSPPASIVANVRSSGDFEFQASHISDLSGSKDHVYIDTDRLVGPTDPTETWADHFINNGWTTIQDQIDAGFPIYAQPTDTVDHGIYMETIDFGAIFASGIVTITFAFQQFDDDHPVSFEVRMHEGITDVDISEPAGVSQFIEAFQFVTFRIDFIAANNHALAAISNLEIRVDVKKEQDGGVVSCLASDVGGTLVSFHKSFKFVDSIVATPTTSVERKAVVSFTSAPNPTDFRILVFDTSLARVDSEVRWLARGVV